MSDLTGRIVLVTGASRGIGYQAALEAARRGAHVIAVARTVGGLEELDDEIAAAGGQATLVPLDLRDGDGIDRLGQSIFERWGRLDGLVGNAGVLGTITPLSHLDIKDFDQAFAVNVTANYRLIRSLVALLRQSDVGQLRLGALCRDQGGARDNDQELRARAQHLQRQGQCLLARRRPHRHACQGDARRRS